MDRQLKRVLAFLSLFYCTCCFSSELQEKSIIYDAHGNISSYRVPSGEVKYSYDPVERLTDVFYPNGDSVHYAYDYNSNLTETSDRHGTTSYFYDESNWLISAKFSENTGIFYKYDPAGRIIKLIYPDKEEVNYSYDARGRLISVADLTGITKYEYG